MLKLSLLFILLAKTYLEDDFSQSIDLNKRTLLLGHSTNTNTMIRLQLDEIELDSSSDIENRIGLLFNFSMGSNHHHQH